MPATGVGACADYTDANGVQSHSSNLPLPRGKDGQLPEPLSRSRTPDHHLSSLYSPSFRRLKRGFGTKRESLGALRAGRSTATWPRRDPKPIRPACLSRAERISPAMTTSCSRRHARAAAGHSPSVPLTLEWELRPDIRPGNDGDEGASVLKSRGNGHSDTDRPWKLSECLEAGFPALHNRLKHSKPTCSLRSPPRYHEAL